MPTPKIIIENDSAPAKPDDMRLQFATSIINALVIKYGDIGGAQDSRLVTEAYRLADLMVDAYFKET
jgi:hypothetical protein